MRNTRQFIAIWIKRDGNEGRETIQWLINQLAKDCKGASKDDPPSAVEEEHHEDEDGECKDDSEADPPIAAGEEHQEDGECKDGSEADPHDEEPPEDAGHMDEEPPEDERTIEEKHRNAIINELLRDLLCGKLIWLPSRGAFRLKVKGHIQTLEVRLRQYAKVKRDIDAGGTFNVLRERYNEAKDTLEEHLRNAADAMDECPRQEEPRDADEHLQVAHPPTPPPGASVGSEGEDTHGGLPDSL